MMAAGTTEIYTVNKGSNAMKKKSEGGSPGDINAETEALLKDMAPDEINTLKDVITDILQDKTPEEEEIDYEDESRDTFTIQGSPTLNSSQSTDSYSPSSVYIRSNLELLSKTELIDIIIELQKHNISHKKRSRHRHKKRHNAEQFNATRRQRAQTLPFNKKNITRPYKDKTVHRRIGTERNPINYERIEKQRAAIKSLKANRKKASQNPMDSSHPHAEKAIKKIKATERNPTNWDLIEKTRADIKALKQERRREKLQNQNSIKWRREKAQQKMLGLFNHAHEHKYKQKRKRKQPRITVRRERIDNNAKIKPNNGKVRIMRDDEVLRFSQEIPIDNFLKAINSGFVKIMNEDEQNEEYFKVTESAKNMMENDDLCNYQFVVTEYNDDSDSDWDDVSDEEEQYKENEEYDDDEMLQKELLLLNIKTLKKQCKKYRLSCHGGKLELIQKIIMKKKDTGVK